MINITVNKLLINNIEVNMEEFEYFPIAELYSVPYMNISFDVKI